MLSRKMWSTITKAVVCGTPRTRRKAENLSRNRDSNRDRHEPFLSLERIPKNQTENEYGIFEHPNKNHDVYHVDNSGDNNQKPKKFLETSLDDFDPSSIGSEDVIMVLNRSLNRKQVQSRPNGLETFKPISKNSNQNSEPEGSDIHNKSNLNPKAIANTSMPNDVTKCLSKFDECVIEYIDDVGAATTDIDLESILASNQHFIDNHIMKNCNMNQNAPEAKQISKYEHKSNKTQGNLEQIFNTNSRSVDEYLESNLRFDDDNLKLQSEAKLSNNKNYHNHAVELSHEDYSRLYEGVIYGAGDTKIDSKNTGACIQTSKDNIFDERSQNSLNFDPKLPNGNVIEESINKSSDVSQELRPSEHFLNGEPKLSNAQTYGRNTDKPGKIKQEIKTNGTLINAGKMIKHYDNIYDTLYGLDYTNINSFNSVIGDRSTENICRNTSSIFGQVNFVSTINKNNVSTSKNTSTILNKNISTNYECHEEKLSNSKPVPTNNDIFLNKNNEASIILSNAFETNDAVINSEKNLKSTENFLSATPNEKMDEVPNFTKHDSGVTSDASSAKPDEKIKTDDVKPKKRPYWTLKRKQKNIEVSDECKMSEEVSETVTSPRTSRSSSHLDSDSIAFNSDAEPTGTVKRKTKNFEKMKNWFMKKGEDGGTLKKNGKCKNKSISANKNGNVDDIKIGDASGGGQYSVENMGRSHDI